MFHVDKYFDTARDFLYFFLQDDWFRTSTKFHANQTGKGGMIFRGQSDAAWRLIPSAFRTDSLLAFTPQPPYEPTKKESLHRYMGVHLHAEARAVFIFLEAADSMGLITPIDYTTTKDSQPLMKAAINGQTDFNYDEPFPPVSFQRATALAQHHGVPTRYLDWSESPLVAAYFAALSISSLGQSKPREKQELAVYFMSTFSLSSEDCPVELVRAPRHENSFLRQQKGVFTNHRTANKSFLESGEWPALDEVSSAGKPQIYRARLAAKEADNLLRELFDLGVTRQSLMPSLDNAAIAYVYARALFDSKT